MELDKPAVITRNGKPVKILIDLDLYEELCSNTIELNRRNMLERMKSPN